MTTWEAVLVGALSGLVSSIVNIVINEYFKRRFGKKTDAHHDHLRRKP